ncbi:NUDIX domain-containing protein [Lichenihabitans sp. PAMC28606]|uniref:NUDIX domain-containing protein n=1 Tax=Lichenihabitans sp. PAMC28606 TaxID=2880932 RepID=UPI001D0B8BB5|nr:NUDIX domain-containing protein [Lichenihabitans sp. PAMC28606]UDL94640.1 NUDIX domain-containing protein [Lichenihabitans sp. PAMC28606]
MKRPTLPAWTRRSVERAIHVGALLTRPLTMGVRAMVIDPEGRILLLRHSYVPGWHFPGGGVERGETIAAAMQRECREEAGVHVKGAAPLHGLFLNRNIDHIAVFVVRDFMRDAAPQPDWEIVEIGFFNPSDLPPGTTDATRRRIAEVLDRVPIAETW